MELKEKQEAGLLEKKPFCELIEIQRSSEYISLAATLKVWQRTDRGT